MTRSLKKCLFHHAQCLSFVLFNKINLFLFIVTAIHLFDHDDDLGICIRAHCLTPYVSVFLPHCCNPHSMCSGSPGIRQWERYVTGDRSWWIQDNLKSPYHSSFLATYTVSVQISRFFWLLGKKEVQIFNMKLFNMTLPVFEWKSFTQIYVLGILQPIYTHFQVYAVWGTCSNKT